VEFPTGRYELRGDGVTSPYQWVWIPNPPSAPPPDPVAPPPTPTLAPQPVTPRRSPMTVYRWTDDDGVTTLTDNLDLVPTRYRAQAAGLAQRH
jgi:Domain of unknown function (DUF4124)